MASVPLGHLRALLATVAGSGLFPLSKSCRFTSSFAGARSTFPAGFPARFACFDRQKQECCVLLRASSFLGDRRGRGQGLEQRCRLGKGFLLSVLVLLASCERFPAVSFRRDAACWLFEAVLQRWLSYSVQTVLKRSDGGHRASLGLTSARNEALGCWGAAQPGRTACCQGDEESLVNSWRWCWRNRHACSQC